MQKRRGIVLTGFFFLILSITLYLLSGTKIFRMGTDAVQFLFLPVQRTVHGTFGGIEFADDNVKKLREENRELAGKLAAAKEIEQDVKALRDQFQTTEIPQQSLIAAKVVGSKEFIPGISLPEALIIDKGEKHGIAIGQTVVYKNNLVGKVVKISGSLATVTLISKKETITTGRTLETNALGVIKGEGNGILSFTNVLLSDKLSVDDFVVTKGDKDEKNRGFPPGLVVGKITSVDKKASELFQSAYVQSHLDFSKLSTVFVITSNE